MKIEKSNYKMSKGFKCTYCGGSSDINTEDETISKYETGENKKWMEEHAGYQWTEDKICLVCEKTYSITNGC